MTAAQMHALTLPNHVRIPPELVRQAEASGAAVEVPRLEITADPASVVLRPADWRWITPMLETSAFAEAIHTLPAGGGLLEQTRAWLDGHSLLMRWREKVRTWDRDERDRKQQVQARTMTMLAGPPGARR